MLPILVCCATLIARLCVLVPQYPLSLHLFGLLSAYAAAFNWGATAVWTVYMA